jgi:pyrroloquinoline quinone biosynthesis protein E
MNLMLGVTDRCTGGCVYCSIPERQSEEMSLPEIICLLFEAAAMGCQRLGIWGGEPLCREDLGEIIRHAKDLGMFVTVDTNGHLIPERDEALAPVDHLNISIDGERRAHDAARGPGTFDRTMRGIEHAVGRYNFWTITVLSKANLDQVDWMLDLARRLGFLTTFQVLHHNDQLGRNDGLRPDDAEVREVISYLIARKKEGAPIASSVKFLEYLHAWPDFADNRRRQLAGAPACVAGDLYCNVDVDGRLYPCSLFIDEIDAPNVRDKGFESAFKALKPHDCGACAATCFTEYNLLFGLDWSTGWNWVRALRG